MQLHKGCIFKCFIRKVHIETNASYAQGSAHSTVLPAGSHVCFRIEDYLPFSKFRFLRYRIKVCSATFHELPASVWGSYFDESFFEANSLISQE